jgi:hypothetical protein
LWGWPGGGVGWCRFGKVEINVTHAYSALIDEFVTEAAR